MDWKLSYKKLIRSKEFESFLQEQGDVKLISIVNKPGKEEWQFNFLSKDNTIFVFETEPEIKIVNETIPSSNTSLDALDIENIRVNPQTVLNKIFDEFKDKIKGQVTSKVIMMHKPHGEREEYSITLITSGFEIINVRVDAETNEIKEFKNKSFMRGL